MTIPECGIVVQSKFDNISRRKTFSAIAGLHNYMKYFCFPDQPGKSPIYCITKVIPVPGILQVFKKH